MHEDPITENPVTNANESQTKQEALKEELAQIYCDKIARYAAFTQVISDETTQADTLAKACSVYIETLGAGPSVRITTPEKEIISIAFKDNPNDTSILFAKLNTNLDRIQQKMGANYQLVNSEAGIEVFFNGIKVSDITIGDTENELFFENFSANNQTGIQFIRLVEQLQENSLFTEDNITNSINKQTCENEAIAVIEKVGIFLARENMLNKIRLEIGKAVDTIVKNIEEPNEQREAIALLRHTLGDSPIEIVDTQAAELLDTMPAEELEQRLLNIYDTIVFSNATLPKQLNATVNNEPYSVLYGALISKKTGERYEWGKKRPVFVHFNEALALRVEYTYGDRGESIGRHEFSDGTLIKQLSLVDAKMVHAFRETFEEQRQICKAYIPGTPEAGEINGNGVYVEGVLHIGKGYTGKPRNMHVTSKDIQAVIFQTGTVEQPIQEQLVAQNPDIQLIPYSKLDNYYK